MAALGFKAAGWAYEGDVPPEKKYVMLAVPHTTNWDGLLLVLVTKQLGLPIHWMIKKSWTEGAIGAVVRRTGAIGIDRSKTNNVVDQMVEVLRGRDEMVLAIPPEGTRHLTDHWRSGFYHIARGANVPVVPGYLDYGRKRAGMGRAIHLSGDVRADMDQIRAFYETRRPTPYKPGAFGPIRLREEDAPAGPLNK